VNKINLWFEDFVRRRRHSIVDLFEKKREEKARGHTINHHATANLDPRSTPKKENPRPFVMK
jgi:hypothetical protein